MSRKRCICPCNKHAEQTESGMFLLLIESDSQMNISMQKKRAFCWKSFCWRSFCWKSFSIKISPTCSWNSVPASLFRLSTFSSQLQNIAEESVIWIFIKTYIESTQRKKTHRNWILICQNILLSRRVLPRISSFSGLMRRESSSAEKCQKVSFMCFISCRCKHKT